jgi:hypothetical protein
MIDLCDAESVRKGLELACRDPTRRINPPSISIARNRWQPFTITDPATLSLFNDAAAWDFIADCLAAGCGIKVQPPDEEFNDHAYVMIELCGDKRVYMKIAIVPDLAKVVGISFHYERTT